MNRKVAVEGSLSNVAQDLTAHGYDVVHLDAEEMGEVSAVVITGEDRNVMNMSTIVTKAPVIDARGLTAEEVREELKQRGI